MMLCYLKCVILCYSDNSTINLDRLEYHIREELNKTVPRAMVVLHPLKVCILFCTVSRICFSLSVSLILSVFQGCYYKPRSWLNNRS